MEAVKYRIYNKGELRNIGHGYRIVEIKEGSKWVYVREKIRNKLIAYVRVTVRRWEYIKDSVIVKEIKNEI